MSEANMESAKAIFDVICNALDRMEINYGKNPDRFNVECTMSGNDIPVNFLIRYNPDNAVISFISFLPFKTDDSRRVDMAIAVNAANFGLATGSFDYNIKDGVLMFRIGIPCIGVDVTEKLVTTMLILGVKTVDRYNDQFLKISLGTLELKDFLESEG